MFKVVNWALWWDFEQKNGWIDLYFHATPQPFRLGPLPAADFSAMSAVLSAAKMTGRDANWDGTKKILAV